MRCKRHKGVKSRTIIESNEQIHDDDDDDDDNDDNDDDGINNDYDVDDEGSCNQIPKLFITVTRIRGALMISWRRITTELLFLAYMMNPLRINILHFTCNATCFLPGAPELIFPAPLFPCATLAETTCPASDRIAQCLASLTF